MHQVNFSINQAQLNSLKQQFPFSGKNSDIGKTAIQIVILYFKSLNNAYTFKLGGKNEPDIVISLNRQSVSYEVKGTEDDKIAYSKLKVSSQYCHDALLNGMEIIRVTSIGQLSMTIYFLKHGVDFTLKPEARWSVIKI